MDKPIRLALVGIGKIARDQHLPAIAGDSGFALVAAVSRNARVDGVANFHDLDALIASGLGVDAVSICTPPVGRHRIAAAARDRGWHVMLEKPPGATLGEVRALAATAGPTLYASWHSRAAAGVAPAKAWLGTRRITSVRIDWREDVRHWHPGQDWILAAGGLGAFDSGINALSILTEILPGRVRLDSAELDFANGLGAPIAASLTLVHDEAAPITAEFDFRQEGPPSWDIRVETDAGAVTLGDGGNRLAVDGVPQAVGNTGEYPALYRNFAALIAAGRSDCDLTPFELVADAFLIGKRIEGAAFNF